MSRKQKEKLQQKILQELLAGKINEVRELMKKFPNFEFDFTEMDLSGYNLERLNMSGSILNKTNFGSLDDEITNLWGARLVEARGKEVNFCGTNLSFADMTNAVFLESDFIEAKMRGAILEFADLKKSDFSGAHLFAANFYRADLRDANFEEATSLMHANFRHADLRGTIFKNAIDVEYALFEGTILEKKYPKK